MKALKDVLNAKQSSFLANERIRAFKLFFSQPFLLPTRFENALVPQLLNLEMNR